MILLCILAVLFYNSVNVKSLRYPSCKNCIYYKPSFFDSYNFGECKKFSKIDNKTDILIHPYTHICRENENECGKNGTHFQRKITFFPF